MISLHPKLEMFVQSLDLESISQERKQELHALSTLVQEDFELNSFLFVCTHNSRRSQLAQFWFTLMAAKFGCFELHSFSAGTEATAFYRSAIAALEKVGVEVSKNSNDLNPIVSLSFSEECQKIEAFSKTIDHQSIPKKNLVAIMTCDHANENCPYIAGAEKRIALSYVDPKWADSSSEESEAYELCSRLIATEMKFVFTQAQ